MRDLKLIDPATPRIPDDWRRAYLNRPIEKLPADVTKAYDRIVKLEREKDQIRKELTDKLRWERIWRRILTASATFSWALVVWLVKEFLTRFH